LFDPATKQALPRYPKNIAVVTSPTGAAIRDFQQVLTRRWPMTNVLVVPVRVQGDGAAAEIAAAVKSLQAFEKKIDAIVVTRGGGSIEDLWSFNDEGVCRAVFASKIPVISGVGHEIDVTLCDLVADVRALTPSEAAERLVPERAIFAKQLANVEIRMRGAVAAKIETARLVLDRFTHHRRLTHPLEPIERRAMEVDGLEQRLHTAMRRSIDSHGREISGLAEK
jgi:exodeoxyribonuclease VII large subunit